MKFVSKFTMAAVLALGGPALVIGAPAAAQKKAETPAQPELQLSKAEREALAPLQAAFEKGDYPAALQAATAARSVATGNDAKHFVAQYLYQTGVKMNDYKAQADALQLLAASPKTAQTELPGIQSQLGVIAFNYLRDLPLAERALTRKIELTPNDAESISNLGRVKREMKKPQEALPLFRRAIQVQTAAGQKAPETWHKLALDIAYTAKSPEAMAVSRDLVAAYPTQQNWRDALLIYRELAKPDEATLIDTFRLMRASKSLNGERDYLAYALDVDKIGLPGEAKAVLEEGVGTRMLDNSKADVKSFISAATKRAADDRSSINAEASKVLASGSGSSALKIGDALLGHSDYAKAADLYRAAIQKGGVDANVANTRLGIALALAGRKAESETAFKAVTGARAELANYWLVWLGQRA